MRRTTRIFQIGASVIAMLGLSVTASALPVYVDQTHVFKYINATAATSAGTPAANWFAPGFDDSTWYSGAAPFSSHATSSTILEAANANGPFAPGATAPTPSSFTSWSVGFDPYLRTTFNLAAPTALTVWLAVDNGINSMYINGVLATAAVNAEGNAFRWEHVFDISAGLTVAGTNTFALQLEDHGGLTGFVVMITGDDAVTNPTFSVPAPNVLSLLGMGLVALGSVFRRKP